MIDEGAIVINTAEGLFPIHVRLDVYKRQGLYTDVIYDSYDTEIGCYIAGKNPESDAGLLTLNVYDKNGNLTDTVLEPEWKNGQWYVGKDSIVTSTTYDNSGKETSNTDAMGNTTKYEYDSKGKLNLVTVPEVNLPFLVLKDNVHLWIHAF